jgi:hypothetical protein
MRFRVIDDQRYKQAWWVQTDLVGPHFVQIIVIERHNVHVFVFLADGVEGLHEVFTLRTQGEGILPH